MWIVINGLKAQTNVHDGSIAILPHVRDLIKGPDLPIPLFLKSVYMRDACLTIEDMLTGTFHWNGESRRIADTFRSHFYVNSGTVGRNDIVYASGITGTIMLDASEHDKKVDCTIRVDGRGELPHLAEHSTCFITGVWHNDRGRFQLQSLDRTLRVNPLIIAEREGCMHFDATASVPFSYICNVLGNTKQLFMSMCGTY